MDTESQVIRQQMHQTRAALAEKLETLEEHLIESAHDAASAVTKTVETVTQTINDTVTGARETAQEAGNAIKNAFDLSRQVEKHPWTMVGVSVAAGFLADRLLNGPKPCTPTEGAPRSNGSYTDKTHVQTNAGTEPERHRGLRGKFDEEISKLKGIGIGLALGVLRDIARQYVPENMASNVANIIDSVTVKLGGEPIPGPVLPARGDSGEEGTWEQSEHFGERPRHPAAPRRW